MNCGHVFAELWVSLASLISSYTAAHGLHTNSQAIVELDEDKITVRHGKKQLRLERSGASIIWMRENGSCGMLELTEHGRLRGPAGEQELDMAAEALARDLMKSPTPRHVRDHTREQMRNHTTESTR